jgi:death-on-curing protein
VSEPKWLSRLSVVLLHAESVAEHGGREGLRDGGLLQSALARARNLYSYEAVTEVQRLAAAYGFGIARNHPFLDGNKRTAFLAIGLFLLKNGYVLETDDTEATQTMLALASGALSEAELVEWIRGHSSLKGDSDPSLRSGL